MRKASISRLWMAMVVAAPLALAGCEYHNYYNSNMPAGGQIGQQAPAASTQQAAPQVVQQAAPKVVQQPAQPPVQPVVYAQPAPQERISQEELLAYCPKVALREGTSFYNTYTRKGSNEPSQVIYQASLGNVTRSCSQSGGNMVIKVAAAGRVVPGPQFTPGLVIMPIRVVVMEGTKTLYNKLHKFSIRIDSGLAATQFIFNDDRVTFPISSARAVQVFVEFEK